MRKAFLVLFFIKFKFIVAQNAYDVWPLFVPSTFIKFNTLEVDTIRIGTQNEALNFWSLKAMSFASSEDGGILFMSNGLKVVDSNFQILENGDVLTDAIFYNVSNPGSSSVQGSMALPKKGNCYWLFNYSFTDSAYLGGVMSPDRLYYSVIDMDANNGAGKVERKLNIVYDGVQGDCRLTAVRHGNGRDWWLVNRGWNNNKLHVYLVTPDTILTMPQQTIGLAEMENDLVGQAMFSLDGTQYASGCLSSRVNIFDFDRCTGIFSNPRNIKVSAEPPYSLGGLESAVDGLCWSPSGQYLYVNTLKYLLQFDTWQNPIEPSRILIAKKDSTFANSSPFENQAITPNGKILISNYHGMAGDGYHLINEPDSQGISCNFVSDALKISNAISSAYLPNLPNYALGAMVGCDTFYNGVQEENAEITLKVFPNPATDWVHVEGLDGEGRIQVFNSNGGLVLEESIPRHRSIRISQWPPGFYSVVVFYKDKYYKGSFVK